MRVERSSPVREVQILIRKLRDFEGQIGELSRELELADIPGLPAVYKRRALLRPDL